MENELAHDVFLAGLKNARAMEKQALSIMQPQLNRVEHYPDLSRRLESRTSQETQLPMWSLIDSGGNKERS